MQYLGVDELGAVMGLAKRSIYRRRTYMPEKLPPAIKIGGRLRWNADTVDEWLKEHEEKEETR